MGKFLAKFLKITIEVNGKWVLFSVPRGMKPCDSPAQKISRTEYLGLRLKNLDVKNLRTLKLNWSHTNLFVTLTELNGEEIITHSLIMFHSFSFCFFWFAFDFHFVEFFHNNIECVTYTRTACVKYVPFQIYY